MRGAIWKGRGGLLVAKNAPNSSSSSLAGRRRSHAYVLCGRDSLLSRADLLKEGGISLTLHLLSRLTRKNVGTHTRASSLLLLQIRSFLALKNERLFIFESPKNVFLFPTFFPSAPKSPEKERARTEMQILERTGCLRLLPPSSFGSVSNRGEHKQVINPSGRGILGSIT